MTEPIYNYVPGKGWIPRVEFIFTPDLYKGKWFRGNRNYYYPEIYRDCRRLDIEEGTDPVNGLKPGDFIPFNERYGYVIISINPNKSVVLYSDGNTADGDGYLSGYWEDVARLHE